MPLSFRFHSPALPATATVVAFHGSEGVSRPYAFDIYLNVKGTLDVDLDAAPGEKARLSIESGIDVPMEYGGIIAQLDLVRALHLGTDVANALYLVRLVPRLWMLSLTRHSRIFTKQSIPDIIGAVLRDEGVPEFEFRLSRGYEAEEHVTQYKESSLDFIQRWMEREGLYYFFEQSDGSETLVITDDKSFASLSRKAPVRYDPGGEGDHGARAHFDTFIARNASLPGTVRFTDYDYGKPALVVRGSSKVSKGSGEHVTYGNRFFTAGKGDALATIRAEDFRARAKNVHASGPVANIAAGYLFALEQHPKPDLNTEYFAVGVDHYGRHAGVAEAWAKFIPHDHDQDYRVDVTAILATQQYRHPEVTPWPRIDGFENANVDGQAASEYAQIDDHGRYALKFKFDEGTLTGGKASTYVRKMQPHAGSVEGWHFPERKGTEVICAFLGGDPDRPVIIGAVPTAIHPAPVTSANHTQNVIQTGGYNRFELEDQAGAQRVTLSTPTAKTHLVMGSPVDGHELVARTEGNSLHHTDVNHDQFVGANCTIVINAIQNETIGATKTQTVTGIVTHVHLADHDHTTAGDHSHETGGDHEHKTGGNHKHETGADHEHKTGGDHKHETGGDHEHKTGGDHKHKTCGDHEHKTEGNCKQETDGEHKWAFNADLIGHVAGQWNHVVDGLTDWKFEAAKNETVAGIAFNKFLGVKMETVAGAHIGTYLGVYLHTVLGAKVELHAGPYFEAGPFANEIKGMQTELKGTHQALRGLSQATHGLKLLEAGVVNHDLACRLVTAGFDNTAAGLKMFE